MSCFYSFTDSPADVHRTYLRSTYTALSNGVPDRGFLLSPTDVFTDILYSHLTCTTICKICYQLPCHSADLDSQLTIPIKES